MRRRPVPVPNDFTRANGVKLQLTQVSPGDPNQDDIRRQGVNERMPQAFAFKFQKVPWLAEKFLHAEKVETGEQRSVCRAVFSAAVIKTASHAVEDKLDVGKPFPEGIAAEIRIQRRQAVRELELNGAGFRRIDVRGKKLRRLDPEGRGWRG